MKRLQNLHIKVDLETKEKIEREASRLGLSLSAFIRLLVAQYFEKRQNN